MAITDTTLVYPGRLVPVTISSCASRRCPSSSVPIGSPFRSCAGRNDQSRRSWPESGPRAKPMLKPDSKAKHARSRCLAVSAPRNADAAPVIRSAVSGTASRSLLPTTPIIRRPGYPWTRS